MTYLGSFLCSEVSLKLLFNFSRIWDLQKNSPLHCHHRLRRLRERGEENFSLRPLFIRVFICCEAVQIKECSVLLFLLLGGGDHFQITHVLFFGGGGVKKKLFSNLKVFPFMHPFSGRVPFSHPFSKSVSLYTHPFPKSLSLYTHLQQCFMNECVK